LAVRPRSAGRCVELEHPASLCHLIAVRVESAVREHVPECFPRVDRLIGRNLDRWMSLIDRGDVPGLHRVLTGLDRDSIEMREVSPMGGLLSQDERMDVL
jgi:hypothetical protein